MEFATWYAEVNKAMINLHYHSVGQSNTLLIRLYNAGLSVADSVEVLHNQWVIDANLFAHKLVEQVQQGVTFTVWHEFLRDNPPSKYV